MFQEVVPLFDEEFPTVTAELHEVLTQQMQKRFGLEVILILVRPGEKSQSVMRTSMDPETTVRILKETIKVKGIQGNGKRQRHDA